MRKFLVSLLAGSALAAALSVAAAACPYHETSASASDAAQTAQAQPASSQN